MSEVADLEQAVDDASLTLAGEAGHDAVASGRVARSGATALAAYRRFDASPLSRRPPEGAAPDPTREARHNVRAAAQGVLAQLEMITLAWATWNAATREEMLHELEAATRELEQRVRYLLGA